MVQIHPRPPFSCGCGSIVEYGVANAETGARYPSPAPTCPEPCWFATGGEHSGHQFGVVAQLVERRACIPEGVGAKPTGSTIFMLVVGSEAAIHNE